MLTKEQIDRYRVYDCGGDGQDCDCPLLRGICDQAEQAIDLAAENERLKAKLDAVREECYTTVAMQGPISNKQIVASIRSILHRILAIIDKDGDTK